MKVQKNMDYEITKSVLFDNDRGFALGHNPNAVAPHVTWQFTQTQEGRSYYWGHYHGDEARAEGDFRGCLKDYADRYGCHIAEKTGVELYKYYSTQRPVDLGTFPKSINNPPVCFANYDERRPVENGSFRAWGELLYLDPLTGKDISNYELRPAPDNPDWAKPSIAAQLAESADRAAKENAARPAPEKKTDKER